MSLIKFYRLVCFFILETKLSGFGANDVCFKLGFDSWVRVEAVGMSSGIWVLWRNDISVSIYKTHRQFILLNMRDNQGKSWMMAMVYGSPTRSLRQKLWNDLGKTKCGIEEPWITMGDFNAVT